MLSTILEFAGLCALAAAAFLLAGPVALLLVGGLELLLLGVALDPDAAKAVERATIKKRLKRSGK